MALPEVEKQSIIEHSLVGLSPQETQPRSPITNFADFIDLAYTRERYPELSEAQRRKTSEAIRLVHTLSDIYENGGIYPNEKNGRMTGDLAGSAGLLAEAIVRVGVGGFFASYAPELKCAIVERRFDQTYYPSISTTQKRGKPHSKGADLVIRDTRRGLDLMVDITLNGEFKPEPGADNTVRHHEDRITGNIIPVFIASVESPVWLQSFYRLTRELALLGGVTEYNTGIIVQSLPVSRNLQLVRRFLRSTIRDIDASRREEVLHPQVIETTLYFRETFSELLKTAATVSSLTR